MPEAVCEPGLRVLLRVLLWVLLRVAWKELLQGGARGIASGVARGVAKKLLREDLSGFFKCKLAFDCLHNSFQLGSTTRL